MSRALGEIGRPLNEDEGVTNPAQPDWSPADNPHAIAISEAQWWLWAVQLAVLRLRDPDDQRIAWPSSRQIDARHLVFALRQLLSAARLADVVMEERGMDAAARDALAQARQRFEDALPGIKNMRDALMHFDEWARGEGRGPQKDRRDAGQALRDVAREFWGFGYDPKAGTVSLCPDTIHADTAAGAAKELSWAIYQAAREIDQAIATEMLARTVSVLTADGVSCSPSRQAPVWVRVKDDSRVWLSLVAGLSDHGRRDLSERIVRALTDAGLRLVSIAQADDLEIAERLARGEALFVEADTPATDRHLCHGPLHLPAISPCGL